MTVLLAVLALLCAAGAGYLLALYVEGGLMGDGLNVQLLDPDDVKKMIRDRTHWVVLFPFGTGDAIDRFDEALGIYPTFPSAMMVNLRSMMTIIPKAQVSRARLQEVTNIVGDSPIEIGIDQDILTFTTDPEVAIPVALALQAFLGPTQEC